MGDMADLELMNCWDEDEMFSLYGNSPAHIQYEHGLCDERGFMYNSGAYKLDRGPGKCPKCKNKTILRSGKFGEFYGCNEWPICDGTRPLR